MQVEVPGAGPVSAALDRPPDARLLYVMAHGAGAGMDHPFMAGMARRLGARRVATLRFQFPYMEARRKRPDPPHLAQQAIRAAVAAAAAAAPDLPRIAGGKSYGGRMTSQTQADEPLADVRGLVFLGFPLHAPGRAGQERAAHLDRVAIPMLFVQGTQDRLANLDLVRGVCGHLGPRASLHVVEGGDHSFNVPKRTGRTDEQVLDGVADAIVSWWEPLAGR